MKLSARFLSMSSVSAERPLWRESATLLLAAPTVTNVQRQNGPSNLNSQSLSQSSLSYLVMKRSKNSKFMPNGIVFPGGTISPIDSDTSRWTKLYKKLGLNLQELSNQLLPQEAHRPNIYIDYHKERIQAGLLSQDITLRITAIRETFEECGVLLLTKPSNLISRKNENESEKLFHQVGESELVKWQNKVRGNPEEFCNLCEHLSVVPDLTRLYEWSNWLTPVTVKYGQRFDTVFYMAAIHNPVPLLVDPHEAQGAEWSTASSLLEKHLNGGHMLMPPQFYELFRLQNVHSVENLKKCMEYRRKLGIERWFPSIIETKNGFVSILPGDELYPKNPEPNLRESPTPTKYDVTVEELAAISKNKHRFRFLLGEGLGGVGVDVNISPRHGHVYDI